MAAKKTADKRSVHTDALETLGTLINKGKQARDAIHLAVEPVTASQMLSAGDHVGFQEDGRVGPSTKPVGIVDPFLAGPVREGEDFWLIVYPRMITSLRHVWEHPDFTPAGPDGRVDHEKENSEKWIRSWLEQYPSLDYDEVMQKAKINAAGGFEFITRGSELEGARIPAEFWEHYKKMTGDTVVAKPNGFFNCSC